MAPPDPRPDHEAIYRLLYERRWAALLDVLHRHHGAIAADVLLDRAVETFLNVLFRALEQADGIAAQAEVLEKLFLLHQGRQYRLPADRYARVVEGLVKADSRVAQFRNARLQGDRLSFSVIEYSGMGNVQHDYTGRVNGDTIEGTVRRTDGGNEQKWTAKRVAK